MSQNDIFSSSQLIPVEKHAVDLQESILINIIKMITNRGYLPHSNLEANIKKILKMEPEDMVYKIPIIHKEFKHYIFRIIPHNISTINKSSGISDFLHTYKKSLNMAIVDDVSKKARVDVFNRFPNSQIFVKSDLLMDLVSQNLIPTHELLNETQALNFYTDYNLKKSNMLKTNYTDPVSKYYNAKPGDIFKVTRPSETAGFVNVYRLVVKKEH